MITAEIKLNACHRLREEGRWTEACEFRERERQRLRADGVGKKEAVDRAWEAMLAAFPPIAEAAEPTQSTSAAVMAPSLAASPVKRGPRWGKCKFDSFLDLKYQVRWVYFHLDVHSVKPRNAPGPGAWALLQWARKYRNQFFQSLLPKAFQR